MLRLFSRIILIGLVFAVGGLYWTDEDLEKRLAPEIVRPQAQDNEASQEQVLFTEVLLSIIRTYYVDAQDLKMESLLLSTLRNLRKSGTYDFDFREDGESLILESGEHVLTTPIPKNGESELFGQQISKLIDFLKLSHTKKDRELFSVMFDVLHALVESFDPHTRLLSKEEYRELKEGTEGSFGGLGILVGIREHLLTVVSSFPRSPAERAGITKQDRILAINGMSTFGMGLGDLINLIRGDPGSELALVLLRDGSFSPQKVLVKREIVEVDPVSSTFLHTPSGRDVAMIKIDSFSAKTYFEFLIELNENINKAKALEGLVIDLRSNPGGLLDQAVRIADLFISKGTIVATQGQAVETEFATKDILPLEVPIVVLVDENTASASEILAGALQDHGKALVIGQPSFGKGTVQTVFELPHDLALKLTVARYFTPRGKRIQDVGVIPDIWLQPIKKLRENVNLLGDLRYRREKFLSHLRFKTQAYHTDVDDGDAAGTQTLLNSYYLKSEGAPDGERGSDTDLALSLRVIDSVHKDHPTNPDMSTSSTRKSIFSGLQKVVANLTSDVDAYLKEHFAINWHKGRTRRNSKLRFGAVSLEAANVFPGESVRLQYELRNESPGEAKNVSIFVRSVEDLDTVEVLLGEVKGSQTLQGTIKFEIPASWDQTFAEYELGLAEDAAYLQGTLVPVRVNVKQRDPAFLVAQSDLVEEIGGRQLGSLEVAETAKLLITLSNSGSIPVEIDAVELVNLSGRQIFLGGLDGQEFGSLHPHSDKVLSIDIAASSRLDSDRLDFGLSIESKDLKKPYFKTFNIPAIPGKRR